MAPSMQIVTQKDPWLTRPWGRRSQSFFTTEVTEGTEVTAAEEEGFASLLVPSLLLLSLCFSVTSVTKPTSLCPIFPLPACDDWGIVCVNSSRGERSQVY